MVVNLSCYHYKINPHNLLHHHRHATHFSIMFLSTYCVSPVFVKTIMYQSCETKPKINPNGSLRQIRPHHMFVISSAVNIRQIPQRAFYLFSVFIRLQQALKLQAWKQSSRNSAADIFFTQRESDDLFWHLLLAARGREEVTPGLYFWQRPGKTSTHFLVKGYKVNCLGLMNSRRGCFSLWMQKRQESDQCHMQDADLFEVFHEHSIARALNDSESRHKGLLINFTGWPPASTLTYCTNALVLVSSWDLLIIRQIQSYDLRLGVYFTNTFLFMQIQYGTDVSEVITLPLQYCKEFVFLRTMIRRRPDVAPIWNPTWVKSPVCISHWFISQLEQCPVCELCSVSSRQESG